jgi:hypothetical protein
VLVVTPDGDRPMTLAQVPPGAHVEISFSEPRAGERSVRLVRVVSLPPESPPRKRTPSPLKPTPAASTAMSIVQLKAPIRVFIQISNTHFVTAVKGGGGIAPPSCADGTVALDPGAATIGAWQTFALISLGEQQYALRTPGGQYVSAVLGSAAQLSASAQTSPLHTDAMKARADEFFTLVPAAGGNVALQTADGVHYVTAVGGGGCAGSDALPFRTDAATIAETEKFWIVPLPGQSDIP